MYTDSYQVCLAMGQAACTTRMQSHYATFIVEDDLRQIAAAGLNYVRLPVPYWAVNPDLSEPYPPNIGWTYVESCIQWAATYGLTVELDLHAAPGAQGGMSAAEVDKIRSWYREVERTIRNITADKTAFPYGGPSFIIHDGFLGTQVYAGSSLQYQALGNTALDLHFYSCFTQSDLQLSWDAHVSQACSTWGPTVASANSGISPTMVGEFSAAYSDCAPYLNGVNELARYDGTYRAESIPNICGCSCTDPLVYDYRNWSSTKKAAIRKFVEAQMSSFEQNGIVS
ncbi:hypothetical protein HDU93_006523 [Gonapodya sp. JEL0774]|nr:hypothetical protein HDU93_006523 [Gonapodya sp. JEL0774]